MSRAARTFFRIIGTLFRALGIFFEVTSDGAGILLAGFAGFIGILLLAAFACMALQIMFF